MELFVTLNNDGFIMDHCRCGRDADTMTRCCNRQGFHMGGHTTHFWDVTNVIRFASFVPSTVDCSDTSFLCFRLDVLLVPTPDVYTLYSRLISKGDQTSHDKKRKFCSDRF